MPVNIADLKLRRLWRAIWPQWPLALFLAGAGLVNILLGLNTGHDLGIALVGQEVSFSALGSAVQIVLGATLVFCGAGLLWRVRIAWSFSILLLLITIAVNAMQGHIEALIAPAIVLVLLIATHHHFWRRTLLGNSLVSVVSVIGVMAYGTFGLYLLGNQFEPHIKSLITALYFLIETLSTTGYGDYHPVTHLAEGFMISVWLIGLGVFATAVISVLGPALTNRMSRIFAPGGERRMHKDHVILVGKGIYARNTAHELVNRSIEFVQLVNEGATPPMPDYPTVFGEPSDDKALADAGVTKARMLVAAEDDDGDNAFICLAAKEANPSLKVLVIASSRRAIRQLKLARADIVFAPTEVGSRLLANLVEGQDLPAEFEDLLTRN